MNSDHEQRWDFAEIGHKGVDLVAVALVYPAPEILSLHLLQRTLIASLRADRVVVNTNPGSMVCTWFILSVFQVFDRNAAIKSITRTVNAMGLLKLVEIGFWDGSEGVWRTAHPVPCTSHFDKFFEPSNLAQSIVSTRRAFDVVRRLSGLVSPDEGTQ